MKPLDLLRHLSVGLATLGLLVPQWQVAMGSELAKSSISRTNSVPVVDVALADQGTLRGQVLDANGAAANNVQVEVLQGQTRVASVTTDANGEFAVAGLKGGNYVVASQGAAGLVRAWAPR